MSNKDKTVIGGSIGGPGSQPLPNPMPGPANPMPGGGRKPASPNQATVIGDGAGPSQGFGGFGGGGAFGAAPPGAPGDDAWGTPTGGFGTPAPIPGQGVGQGGFGQQAGFQQPQQRRVDGAFASTDGFFPDASTAQATNYQHAGPKIDLRTALTAKGLGAGGPKSPMLAAAANLLILFGRLRTQMVEMEAIPLMEYVTKEIEVFEENLQKAGIDNHDAQVAKYMLCGTADDIVQNIPGTDRHIWVQYSMVARFFNRRTSGVGFFQEVEKALQVPSQKFQILELALTCLSLGFEGQYRSAPNGAVELARIRNMVYESLRRVINRPDEDISPRWKPVILGGRRRFGGTPLWVTGSILGLGMLGAYFGLSMLINTEGNAVASRLLEVNPTSTVTLMRTAAFTPLVPSEEKAKLLEASSGQLDRIREALKGDLDSGLVAIDVKGDFIFIRVNNAALFATGKAETKKEFNNLADRIVKTINAEPGPVYIFGYTDNVPMSGRGRFKNNHDLSVARAEAVQKVLTKGMEDPERFIVEGKAEADPIGDNATEEGRALNRRVEVMIKREETLE
ncbi:MAG: type IVB secretion system protein IcmH/DotU [Paracoccaceae bacterium]